MISSCLVVLCDTQCRHRDILLAPAYLFTDIIDANMTGFSIVQLYACVNNITHT